MNHATMTLRTGQDLTGTVVERLEVVRFSHSKESNGKSTNYWLCKCMCSKELTVSERSIKERRRKSCGCIQGESRKKLEGTEIGRWSILRYEGSGMYACQCECGELKSVSGACLRRGGSLSCGCLREEMLSGRKKHGMAKSKVYHTWCAIRDRCSNNKNKAYRRYGGRGISVCKKWDESFDAFLEDMGMPPTCKHTIDRYPDQNGNYEPGNCRWATMQEQQNNRSNNRIIEHAGESKTLAEWCRQSGIKYQLVEWRLRHGWEFKKALETPPRKFSRR